MRETGIFDLPNECFYEIFKCVKNNCEREKPFANDQIKYADFISLAACSKLLGNLIYEWNMDLFFGLPDFCRLGMKKNDIDISRMITGLKNKSAIDKKAFSSSFDDAIDLENICIALKNTPARDKEAYWISFSPLLKDWPNLTEVALRYAPESFHSDLMEVFRTVMDLLQNKPNLKELDIDVTGYTLEGLGSITTLEKLCLNVRMDIDDLVEICRLNKNLRVLVYMNNETGGKRLAAIAPHCEQLEYLNFRMRPECDASEYRPLAKLPRLRQLQIEGVHEKGTLQPLLHGFACNESKALEMLFIEDSPMDQGEMQALSQIDTLAYVKCRLDDPRDIGLLSQLPNLQFLGIPSEFDFGTISEKVLSILIQSKEEMLIDLVNSRILFISQPTFNSLSIYLKEESASSSDYSRLSTLPGLSSLKIEGLFTDCSLAPILNGFIESNLTDLSLINIKAEEVAAVSQIVSQLPVLEGLTISSVPTFQGSLQCLLAALASRPSQTLQKLCLLEGRIDTEEANELIRIRSLRTLECQFAYPQDIQLLSGLTELEDLSLNANEMLGKISPGILTTIKSCRKLARIDIDTKHNQMSSVPVDMTSSEIFDLLKACQGRICVRINYGTIAFDRDEKILCFSMEIFTDNTIAIERLAHLEPVHHIKIYHDEPGSLREYFAALARRTHHTLRSLSILSDCLVDFSEATELEKITSLRAFHGKLSDERRFQHLLDLNDFQECLTTFKNIPYWKKWKRTH
ncbi:uncharacterized protein LOC117897200 [Drosophila subobscura]|uniref:uncharacterized protein LOC117897200 n=1 Tax=Drosophila subobscura TaxID=7241 RepID=UPI00155AF54E|nr:uncharacterized protein LOC117897200 [Drosophila subobscura]